MAGNDVINLTAIQRKAVEELRRRVSKECGEELENSDDKFILYRFLKARDFDVDRSESMLKKSLQWRKANEDIIRNYNPPEVLKKYLANIHLGYDNEGCPVCYVASGKIDTKGLHMSAKYMDIEKTVLQLFMSFENYLEKVNGKLTKFIYIFDETDLTFSNAIDKNGLETMIRLAKVQQDNFPERLKAAYFINVPSYFAIGFNIAKNFLSAETLKKLHVYGTEGWQEELLKVIDADQLPAFMGGTRTDPDGNPQCKTILNQGGKIHEKYFIHKSKNSLAKYPGVQKLHVSRSNSARITLEVPEEGSVIEWEFEIKFGDIAFGIDHADNEDQTTEALPLQRLSTKDFAETGMYECEKPGKYFVVFDNSHSWFISKEIYYRIKIVKSSELEDQINK